MKRKTTQPLQHELVLIADDLAEYVNLTAFLSHALLSSLAEECGEEVIEGARLCARILRFRGQELQQNMQDACERYSEHSAADSPKH